MRFFPYFLLLFFALTIVPRSSTAQWLKTNGLAGGYVYNFLNFGDTLLAQIGGHLYYTSNNGQSWSVLNGSGDVSLNCSATDGQTIVASKYVQYVQSTLRFTGDFGQTWGTIPLPAGQSVGSVFFAQGYLYGVSNNAIYRTDDLGQTWEFVFDKPIYDVQYDGVRMTGTRYPHVLQSTDGGFSWDTIYQYSGNLKGILQKDNHLFLFSQNSAGGCHASHDYGQTWQQFPGVSFDQAQNFKWHNGVLVALKNNKILRSFNLGETWESVDIITPYNIYNSVLAGAKDGSALFLGSLSDSPDGVISKSLDLGLSWAPSAFGVLAEGGKLRTGGDNLYAAGNLGLSTLKSDGLNWEQVVAPNSVNLGQYQASFLDYLAFDNTELILTPTHVLYSVDAGATWQNSDLSLLQPIAFRNKIGKAAGRVVLVEDYDNSFHGLAVSNNGGKSFQIKTSLNQQSQSPWLFYDVADDRIFAMSGKRFWRSDDGGDTWEFVSNNANLDSLSVQFGTIRDLIVRGNLCLVKPSQWSNKLLLSKDQGLSWEIKSNLPFLPGFIYDLLSVGDLYIIATDSGVFVSSDLGETWDLWHDGMTSLPTKHLAIFDGFIWASTLGNGVWKRPLSELNVFPANGLVFQDLNANGVQDPGELNFPNIVVQSLLTPSYTSTRSDGTFSLLSNKTTEVIKANPPKPYWSALPATHTVLIPSTGTLVPLTLAPNAQDLSINLTNIAALRPGFSTDFALDWRNHVPLSVSDVTITLHYPDSLIALEEANPTPTSHHFGKIMWNLGAVLANASGQIALTFYVPATTPIGATACFSSKIEPVVPDYLPNDNVSNFCEMVVGAYDPNDKRSEPENYLSLAQIASGEPVRYIVRFQNTGNYPATFVRILDTLDRHFDPGSFELIASSHSCTWQIRGEGIVEFFFDNIQLPPEETDEPGSHGFVKYSVRPRVNTGTGTVLHNTAHIFFDYNVPIVTNTTKTTMGMVSTLSYPSVGTTLTFSPNPAQSQTRLNNTTAGELSLYDASGKLVLRVRIVEPNSAVSVAQLPTGVYQAAFVAGSEVQRAVLVVQH